MHRMHHNQKKQRRNNIKLIPKFLTAAMAAALVQTSLPALQAGETVTKEVVIEEEEFQWWNASLSTGWDSRYMFRGVNTLGNSGLYWTDLSFTWNITENDSLTVGAWLAFGTGTNYKELNTYVDYTHNWGNLYVSLGYVLYYVFDDNLYSHELYASVGYTIEPTSWFSVTPNIGYYFNLGPDVDSNGFVPTAGSFLALRLDSSIAVYKDIISIDPYVALNFNFHYNSREDGDYFDGVNNFEFGVSVPWQVNEIITVAGYVASSYQWQDLVGTPKSIVWAGVNVGFSF